MIMWCNKLVNVFLLVNKMQCNANAMKTSQIVPFTTQKVIGKMVKIAMTMKSDFYQKSKGLSIPQEWNK